MYTAGNQASVAAHGGEFYVSKNDANLAHEGSGVLAICGLHQAFSTNGGSNDFAQIYYGFGENYVEVEEDDLVYLRYEGTTEASTVGYAIIYYKDID